MNIELYHFMHSIKPIIFNKNFQSQKKFIQHKNVSVYKHVIYVAFLCHKKALKNKKLRHDSLVKAALLHDYFLYDWHDKNSHLKFHGFHHPLRAIINAHRDFHINLFEASIIKTHMWPLTILLIPKSKEAFLLSYYDKVETLREMFS